MARKNRIFGNADKNCTPDFACFQNIGTWNGTGAPESSIGNRMISTPDAWSRARFGGAFLTWNNRYAVHIDGITFATSLTLRHAFCTRHRVNRAIQPFDLRFAGFYPETTAGTEIPPTSRKAHSSSPISPSLWSIPLPRSGAVFGRWLTGIGGGSSLFGPFWSVIFRRWE